MEIGTCVKGEELLTALPAVMDAGFESAEIYFDRGLKNINLRELSLKARELIQGGNMKFSSIGICYFCWSRTGSLRSGFHSEI